MAQLEPCHSFFLFPKFHPFMILQRDIEPQMLSSIENIGDFRVLVYSCCKPEVIGLHLVLHEHVKADEACVTEVHGAFRELLHSDPVSIQCIIMRIILVMDASQRYIDPSIVVKEIMDIRCSIADRSNALLGLQIDYLGKLKIAKNSCALWNPTC